MIAVRGAITKFSWLAVFAVVLRSLEAETCLRALQHTQEDMERSGSHYKVSTELLMRESTAQVIQR
jgi:hypothetical protein